MSDKTRSIDITDDDGKLICTILVTFPSVSANPCAPENRANTERDVRAAIANAVELEERNAEIRRIADQQAEARRQAKKQKKARKKRAKQARRAAERARQAEEKAVADFELPPEWDIPPLRVPRGGVRFTPPGEPLKPDDQVPRWWYP
jgi:hypothetical protein